MKRILAPIVLLTLLFPSLAYGVPIDDLVKRDGLYYEKSSDVPFTGKTTGDEQGTFKNGKKHGHWFVWDNGQLDTAGTYKNGKREGPWDTYHDKAQLRRKGTYKDGKKEGPWESYDKNGQSDEYAGIYKNGVKVN